MVRTFLIFIKFGSSDFYALLHPTYSRSTFVWCIISTQFHGSHHARLLIDCLLGACLHFVFLCVFEGTGGVYTPTERIFMCCLES